MSEITMPKVIPVEGVQGMWMVEECRDKSIRITPIMDKSIHTYDDNCFCNPKIEYENSVKIVVHNSFDRREKNEH